jgi:DNA-binding MarR family transcriptional regulator
MFEAKPPSAGEVRALAQQLLSWADQLALAPPEDHALSEEQLQESVLALAIAGRDIARLRARIFPDTDFASSGWDVMLEIFIRGAQGHCVSLEQLSTEDGWPPLAVHRSVNMLIDKRLVDRSYKDSDTRDVWLSLTSTGQQKMASFLLESARFSRPPNLAGAGPANDANRNPA